MKGNVFDTVSSHSYLIGSYGFFANNIKDLEHRVLVNNKHYFGYLETINYKNPFYRFALNGEGYEFFYKVDNYIPEILEIE